MYAFVLDALLRQGRFINSALLFIYLFIYKIFVSNMFNKSPFRYESMDLWLQTFCFFDKWRTASNRLFCICPWDMMTSAGHSTSVPLDCTFPSKTSSSVDRIWNRWQASKRWNDFERSFYWREILEDSQFHPTVIFSFQAGTYFLPQTLRGIFVCRLGFGFCIIIIINSHWNSDSLSLQWFWFR